MLPAWRPVPSFGSTMILFGIFGFVFLIIGVTLYVLSDKIQEVVYLDYNLACTDPQFCSLSLQIEEDIQQPVFVYYQLDNFYQNHRRYVKSKDAKQLMGEDRTTDEVKDNCNPVIMNGDLNPGTTFYDSPTTSVFSPAYVNNTAWPCGLIAKSVFTD